MTSTRACCHRQGRPPSLHVLGLHISLLLLARASALDDPWKLPFRGIRDPSEGKGPASSGTGGLGIPQLTIPRGRRDIHTFVLTECVNYQDWQTIAAAFAWRESGQPGNVTRVVNCPPDKTDAYSKIMMEVMPTFWARQYIDNAKIKDTYSPYNKPGAVVDFLAKAPAEERYVVVLDSDMLMHKPFVPEDFEISPGWAMGASYSYLAGVSNELAMRHVSNIAPRNDTLAGPAGRRGDQVGGPYLMLTDDLRRVAPLWLSATEEMRQDTQAWKDSGDKAAPGKPVWISEMYGYAFGAARANVWHRSREDFMMYPSSSPSRVPHVIHYGLRIHLPDDEWEFDKHSYLGFDPLKCPPWSSWQGYNVSKLRGLVGDALESARLGPPPKPFKSYPTEGIFPPPPHPSRLHKANPKKEYLDKYRDLMAIFTVSQINAALCEFHSWTCPWSEQLEAVCGDAWELYMDVREQVDAVEFVWDCTDHKGECSWWAKSGECVKGAAYMQDHCAKACAFCTPRLGSDFVSRERRPLTFAKGNREPGASAEAGLSKTSDGGSGATDMPSQMDFASFVRRCTTAFYPPLDYASLGLCVRSAGLGLAYIRPGGALTMDNGAALPYRIQTEPQGSSSGVLGKVAAFTGAFSGTLMLTVWYFERRQTGWMGRRFTGRYARLSKT